MLVAAARHGFESGLARVVIIAEAGSGADQVYTRIGFREIEKMASAVKAPS